ncbi:MAG TPA: sll0787 family AIR synthase-like protein, partial [Dongiaceae bacterium]|nr:sll0787 family AIR synthase-like protein [Dongiaceae bacterium]
MWLTELLDQVRASAGLHSKTEIQLVQRHLREAFPPPFPNGDDAAILPNGNGFDLLAGEGFIDAFVTSDPWFAGWCGIMVNVSDIAAMGGRPVAVVNALWGGNDDATADVLRGMAAASQAYQVPIVGGHTNLRTAQPRLAVSIFGRANKVLDAFAAKPGQVLVAAIDLRGSYHAPFNNWNAATSAPAERLRGDIELLPIAAEKGLATAAKDVSQAGLLGTCVMLLESSQVGVDLDLHAIPKPVAVE